MNQQRRLELAVRRGELSAQIGFQRTALAQQVWPVSNALLLADHALTGVDWLKRNPLAVAAAFIVLAVMRPSRTWRWGKTLFFLWHSWQGLRIRLLG